MNITDVIRSLPGFDGQTDGVNEYTGDDGLIYCVKCRTPKQTRLDILGETRVVGHICQCQAEALDREDEERKREKRRALVKAWRNQGLTDGRWHSHTFEGDDRRDSNASLVCLNYVKHFDSMLNANYGLLMYGGVGSGKTYLAAAIANALVDQGRYVLMDTLPSLIARINADYGDDREYWFGKIEQAHLVALDDFGVERGTDYAMEQAYEIINARYKANKPLIVTTNLSLEQLGSESNIGKARIYDRIREMCVPLMIAGDTRRKDIAKAMRAEAAELLRGGEHEQV